MFAILSIVIGILFSLMLMSILASTIHDIWAMLSSLHSKKLQQTLKRMLGKELGGFTEHPYFRQLTQHQESDKNLKPSHYPVWIDKKTFSSILVDIIQHGKDGKAGQTLQDGIDKIPDPKIKRMLEFLLRESDGNLDKFKGRAENWFAEVMERATALFAHSTKWRLFFIGLVTATLLNVDTIQMYRRLSANADLRESLERDAEKFVNGNSQLLDLVKPKAVTDTSGTAVVTTVDTLQLIAAKRAIIDTLKTQYYDKYSSGLGLGWEGQTAMAIPDFLVKLLGLLLTAISVTFGAPFWFDLLRKILPFKGGSSSGTSQSQPETTPNQTAPVSGNTSPKPSPTLPDLMSSSRAAQKPPVEGATAATRSSRSRRKGKKPAKAPGTDGVEPPPQ
jgi:hypothetical protein